MPETDDWLTLLHSRLERLTRSYRADFSVFARFVEEQREIAINADREMDMMSLIKVPILVTLMRAVDADELSLSDPITLQAGDKRQGSGVLLHFDEGAQFTLGDAARLMIVVSDNTATDLVLRALGGIDPVNQSMADLGLSELQAVGDTLAWFRALGTRLDPDSADLPPGELFEKGWPKIHRLELEAAMRDYHSNGGAPFSLGTARALGNLFGQILGNECASAAACARMISILEGQQLQYRLPKLGFGLTSAHKTGDFPPFISNDGGIFTTASGANVILVVLTRNFAGERAIIDDAVGKIGEMVFAAADARADYGAGRET